ncbi:YxlC family protein [Bacillus inaquosorum]|uniref:YxlC family protein n=1 Tax=Bacillus inaquosorum TaxID=483913 RepID=UPI0022824E0D|nr:YxlC family protein [Bacillus inaquosorum]MCY7899697.1 YxlC family protein [Bacillus inaquosorum]MCY8262837.1 YxlC family protein [Bacillus inaquosorum]MCY8283009.1 YxlC family protein [Bacillus inaquosorum]MCY9455804.1 YxlC family protein [Bacillus inaquosorum]
MNKEKLSIHFRSELQKIDQTANPSIPDQKELLYQLLQMKAERRKKLMKEIILFVFCALMVVSAAILAFTQAPAVFIVLQVCVLAVLPILIAAEKKRHLGECEVERR